MAHRRNSMGDIRKDYIVILGAKGSERLKRREGELKNEGYEVIKQVDDEGGEKLIVKRSQFEKERE